MKISIIMCAKNSMPYMMAAVESFIKQNYKNKELIIVFSKSNDHTTEFIKSLKHKNIKKIKFNGSIYGSLNYGIKKSRGDVVGVLHSDDVFYSKSILSEVAAALKRKKYDVLYGNILYCEKNNLLNIKRDWSKIKLKNKFDLPPHTSLFLRKKIFDNLKFDKKYIISSDTDFLLKLFRKNIQSFYLNKYITIMRMGGISTKLSFFIKKFSEDIKIFYNNQLSIFHYFKKLFFKLSQIIFIKKFEKKNFHKNLNNFSKVKFIDTKNLINVKGKIVSALNLAFISYDYKFNLRSHKYLFWPDGMFSTYLLDQKKVPGRIYFSKYLKLITYKRKKFKKIFVLGNLPKISRDWLKKNINQPFEHKNFPFTDIGKLKNLTKKIKLKNNSLVILTLPTPKQEIVSNLLIKKYPSNNFFCIGGSINILSGLEKEAPTFLYLLNLEWLWRLKFDTIRRLMRLTESFFLYFKLSINKKNKIF